MARSSLRPITEVTEIDVQVETYLRTVGGVFRTFAHQDSGTTSYGRRAMVREAVHRPGHRRVSSPRPAPQLRCPTSGVAAPPQLGHDPRRHRAGEWAPGEVLNDPRFTRDQRRHDPAHPHVRFRSLPVERILAALGSSTYTFSWSRKGSSRPISTTGASSTTSTSRTHLCDLEYREGPFVLERDRAYGSSSWPPRSSNAARSSTR